MDTTSNALSVTLWRLAMHQDVQDRLREEIGAAREATGGCDIAYDDLVALPYLDAVCRETLRVYVWGPRSFALFSAQLTLGLTIHRRAGTSPARCGSASASLLSHA